MIRARKIEYVVHLEKLDDDGNVVDELTTQKPLTLFAYQFATLPAEIEQIVAQVTQQQASA